MRGKVARGKVARGNVAARYCRRGSVARGNVAEPDKTVIDSMTVPIKT